MPEPIADTVRGAAVLEHPAVRAWLRARPGGGEPTAVALLKQKAKSAVYRLVGVGPRASTVVAKRCGAEGARVERVVYGAVLSRLPVPTLGYHGSVEGSEGCWLFLEECTADKYSSSLEEHRRLAGRWLGLLHTSAAGLAGDVPLPDRGPAHYWRCLRRVRDAVARHLDDRALGPDEEAVLASVGAACDALAARWGQLEELCAGMPRTLVHGDFIKRNLRVRPGPPAPTLVAYDWEVAGWGPPAVDLARPPFSGNPDLTAYREAVRERWTDVELPTVQRWAALGTLFRFLAAADWEASEQHGPSVARVVPRLAVYPSPVAEAFTVLGWAGGPVEKVRTLNEQLGLLEPGYRPERETATSPIREPQ